MAAEDDPKTQRSEPGQPAAGEVAAESSGSGVDAPDMAAQRAETERFRDLYLRERAEFENYKKRLQRDHGEALRYASTHLARDLAQVLDDLERAIEHAESGGNGEPLVEGVRMVLRNAMDALSRHGITRIDATGERFDPARHEAIATVRTPEHEPNRVVQQFQPGYVLHDRVIRPAKVSVSTKPEIESPKTGD
ncbi:MAG: nucleotide exchange factor GrpE [Candidatus Binatia bacterium]